MRPDRSQTARIGFGLLAVAASALCLAAAPQLTPSVERGAEVAQSRCASCHGVALETASPSREAPLFRVLSRLYSAQDLQRKLSDISQNGHFEMPAVSIPEDEIEDVSAYIASLNGGASGGPGASDRGTRREGTTRSLRRSHALVSHPAETRSPR